MRSSNKNAGHVAQDQPLIHLFTVSLSEVEKRVGTGSKWLDKPHPKGSKKEVKK